MVKVWIDVPVNTPTVAVGQLNGEVELPVLPQIGDAIVLDVAMLGQVPAANYRPTTLIVAQRILVANTMSQPQLLMQELVTPTIEESVQAIKHIEEAFGLLGSIWDDDRQPSRD